MDKYDVVVIGGGPDGYVAAIRCAQLGFKVVCVESWLSPEDKAVLGGTCLNVGCIPSKALLDSSHHYEHIKNDIAEHGISVGNVNINIQQMMRRKDKLVKTLTTGIAALFKKNNIEWLRGHGRIIDRHTIEITPQSQAHDEIRRVTAEHIIIATGSVPAQIPAAKIDNRFILDSAAALSLSEVPRKLGIIGAGVIGLELGSVWNRLGAEVTLFEAQNDFLSTVDDKIAKVAFKTLKRQGLDIRLGAVVTGTGTGSNNTEVTVNYNDADGKQQITFNKLLVCVGREPNTKGLGCIDVGIEINEGGFINVDANCQTSIDNIYAIGDVVQGPMLAHRASEQGVAVAECLAGQKSHVNEATIPWVIYTWPEIAWVGKTQQQLDAEGIEYKIGSFPFIASGRAKAMSETTGMVRMMSCAETDRILGVHIYGPNASELIAEAVLAMEFDASAEDIARTIHAHPTLSEAMHEAALSVDDRTLHM